MTVTVTVSVIGAGSSVSLNLAEGAGRSGRDRLHHDRIAAGNAREVRAGLQIGEAWGDLEEEAARPLFAKFDRLHVLCGPTH